MSQSLKFCYIKINFYFRAVEWIETWRNIRIKDRIFSFDLLIHRKVSNFIQLFMPTEQSSDHFNAQKIVLLFKYISVQSFNYNNIVNITQFVQVIKPYIEPYAQTMNKGNHIEEFADSLSLVSSYCCAEFDIFYWLGLLFSDYMTTIYCYDIIQQDFMKFMKTILDGCAMLIC